MGPEFVERLFGGARPELSPDTLGYIEACYERMLAEVNGEVPRQFEDMEYMDADFLHIDSGVDTALATYIVWGIRQTLFDDRDKKVDFSKIGRAEMERREILGEILEKAGKYSKWASKHGLESLVDQDKVYSAERVTYLIGRGIKEIFGLSKGSEYKRFRWMIQPPPSYKAYAANQ